MTYQATRHERPRFPGVTNITRPSTGVGSFAPDPWMAIDGSFTCLGVWNAKGAASYAASLVNQASPGINDAVAGTVASPNWDTSWGWIFTGQCLVVPRMNATRSIFVKFNGGPASSANRLIGSAQYPDTGNRFWILPSYSAATNYQGISAGATIATAVTSGIVGIAGFACWRDGVKGATLASFNGDTLNLLGIGGQYEGGTSVRYALTCNVQCVWMYSTILDDAQSAQVCAAMAAY